MIFNSAANLNSKCTGTALWKGFSKGTHHKVDKLINSFLNSKARRQVQSCDVKASLKRKYKMCLEKCY